MEITGFLDTLALRLNIGLLDYLVRKVHTPGGRILLAIGLAVPFLIFERRSNGKFIWLRYRVPLVVALLASLIAYPGDMSGKAEFVLLWALNTVLAIEAVVPFRRRNIAICVWVENWRFKWSVVHRKDEKVVVVLGPAGSGKSSLLRRIAEDGGILPGCVLSVPDSQRRIERDEADGDEKREKGTKVEVKTEKETEKETDLETLTSKRGDVVFTVMEPGDALDKCCRSGHVMGVVCVLDTSVDTVRGENEPGRLANRETIKVLSSLDKQLKMEVPFVVLGNKADTLDLPGIAQAEKEIEGYIREGGFILDRGLHLRRRVQYFLSSLGDEPQGFKHGLFWLAKRMIYGNSLQTKE